MENCLKPKTIWQINKKTKVGNYYVVPCGQCPLCKNSRRMGWLMRIESEHKKTQYPNAWFLTLTYNEKKVPRKKGIKTLYKRHPQLFFKRLRKTGAKIKYILVGEYGKRTERPHYHVICWTTASVDAIDKAWNYGHVHYRGIGKESILYTLKYIIDPRQGDNEVKQKEYAVFSQGLGLSYMTTAMYYYHNPEKGKPKFTCIIDGREVPLPRYYRHKIFTKYQLRTNAGEQYYRALKAKHSAMKKLKKLGHPIASKAYKAKVLAKAEKIVFKNKSIQTL